MPKTTLYNLNSNSGPFIAIVSTIPARRVEIREDESTSPQGLQYQKPDDNFVSMYTVGTPGAPDQAQIILGNLAAQGGGRGPLVGLPPQSIAASRIAATVYLKARSRTSV